MHFVNSKFGRDAGEWTAWEVLYVQLVKYSDEEPVDFATIAVTSDSFSKFGTC